MFPCPVCSWNNEDYETECTFCGFPELGRYFYDEEATVIRACKTIWRKQALKLIEVQKEYRDMIGEFTELQEEHNSLCDDYDALQAEYDDLKESYAGLEREFKVLANAFAKKIINERGLATVQTPKTTPTHSSLVAEECDSRDFYMDGDTLREYRGIATTVDVPDYVKKVWHAFMDNEKVTAVFLHDEINEIGDRTFSGCSNLEMVILPTYIKRISGGTFMRCKKLRSIVIPPFVEEIGGRAFERCEGLVSVEIPNSVQRIAGYAFENCINLQHLYITTSVQDIGTKAFTGCKKLTIHAPKGSYAEWYASRMGIPFIPT